MIHKDMLLIDNKEVQIEGERNILELVRKAGIDLPTFCYYSEISIYGACRLCMVDIEGRGMVPACSTLPEAGMKVKTQTEEIRNMRKIIVELLLANHSSNCPTCSKSADCQLQNLGRRLGVTEIRFKAQEMKHKIDDSSAALVRDPNKCVLCGDCVRFCDEIQAVGALDFAFRGSKSIVIPSFGKDLNSVECVYCGQCARVCPTGAITPKSEIEAVWKSLLERGKQVVAQIAPAVRVSLGEEFGLEPGITSTGKIIAALRSLGFDKVYDTAYAADLTVVEEANEFIERVQNGGSLPQFTSCCPAWIKFVEQYYPNFLSNLSTCRSPQQMFGSLCKEKLPQETGITREDLVVVAIMPCTAKKFEAGREEFMVDGNRDVDHVLTVQELARMIYEAGIRFNELEPESFDMPFGYKTGAGIIFGNSGGVSEAVLRYATEKLSGVRSEAYEFAQLRGEDGIRTTEVAIGTQKLRMAVVSGLANARKLLDDISTGRAEYDIVEVMACPGGCVGGAGQPVSTCLDVREKRKEGLYETDRMLQFRKSQDNPHIEELYETFLGEPGGHTAHRLLHTGYGPRKRLHKDGVTVLHATAKDKVEVSVCIGTSCFMRGSQKLMKGITDYVHANKFEDKVEVNASFCFETCARGPVVRIAGEVIEKCEMDTAIKLIEAKVRMAGRKKA